MQVAEGERRLQAGKKLLQDARVVHLDPTFDKTFKWLTSNDNPSIAATIMQSLMFLTDKTLAARDIKWIYSLSSRFDAGSEQLTKLPRSEFPQLMMDVPVELHFSSVVNEVWQKIERILSNNNEKANVKKELEAFKKSSLPSIIHNVCSEVCKLDIQSLEKIRSQILDITQQLKEKDWIKSRKDCIQVLEQISKDVSHLPAMSKNISNLETTLLASISALPSIIQLDESLGNKNDKLQGIRQWWRDQRNDVILQVWEKQQEIIDPMEKCLDEWRQRMAVVRGRISSLSVSIEDSQTVNEFIEQLMAGEQTICDVRESISFKLRDVLFAQDDTEGQFGVIVADIEMQRKKDHMEKRMLQYGALMLLLLGDAKDLPPLALISLCNWTSPGEGDNKKVVDERLNSILDPSSSNPMPFFLKTVYLQNPPGRLAGPNGNSAKNFRRETKGIFKKALRERYPELTENVGSFKELVIRQEGDTEEVSMKKWRLRTAYELLCFLRLAPLTPRLRPGGSDRDPNVDKVDESKRLDGEALSRRVFNPEIRKAYELMEMRSISPKYAQEQYLGAWSQQAEIDAKQAEIDRLNQQLDGLR